MQEISIVIPVFNEEQNINTLYNEITKNLLKKYNFEIIYINDGSTDNTKSILKNLYKSKFINIVEHDKNLGQSRSILSGIKKSKFQNIVTIDGDGQNNPIDIPKLLDLYFSNNYDLVAGIRTKRKDNIIKIVSSKIANKIRSSILKDNCPDTGCSLKVFNKHVFLEFPYFDGIHRFLPALFKCYNKKIHFVSVGHRPRIKGISKYGTIDRLFKGIYDLYRVRNIIKKHTK
tara:strand:+ start:987 stop:1676 length:690 start_codon:yes stop_codon:yes gene_type:complete